MLRSAGFEPTVVNTSTDRAAYDRVTRVLGAMSVPVITYDDAVLRGYDRRQINALIQRMRDDQKGNASGN
jgi:hypothetical protein